MGNWQLDHGSLEKVEGRKCDQLESSSHFEVIFRCSPHPILIFGEAGILDCNPAAVKILGASSKEWLLSHHPAFFSPKLQPDGRSSQQKCKEMDRIAQEKGQHVFEWTHKKFDGTEFPVEVTLAPIQWEGRKGMLVMWVDLSEKKKKDLQLLHHSKLASMGEMAAGIAHEINNPLAIINGSIFLLSSLINQPEKFTAKVEMMLKSCNRISKIVGGLKKFSRVSNQEPYGVYSLKKIVQDSLILTEAKSKKHDTQVTFVCDSDLEVNGNEVELEQVMVNLIHNAIDAVKDTPTRWVQVSAYEEDSWVILRVMDSGMGIPENLRNKLFEPFFTTKEIGEGTGLGLSITKGILDAHSASISVVDGVPHTCFEIKFLKAESKKEILKKAVKAA